MTRAAELGMDRAITRRDFLNGIAVAARGRRAERRGRPPSRGLLSPALTGLRGSHEGSFEVAHQLRDGAYCVFPSSMSTPARSTTWSWSEEDLRSFRSLFLPEDDGRRQARPHPRQPRRLRRARQAQRVHAPGADLHRLRGHDEHRDSVPVQLRRIALVEELGIRVDRYPEFVDRGSIAACRARCSSTGRASERTVSSRECPAGATIGGRFFESPALRESPRRLVRLYDGRTRRTISVLSAAEKRDRLARMSYQDYLLKHAGVTRRPCRSSGT